MCFEDKSLIPKPDKNHRQLCLGSYYWLQSKTVISFKCAFGGQNTDYKPREESYSSVFIEDKSLIAKPGENHIQACLLKTNHWLQNQTIIIVKCIYCGQITDYKIKLKLLTNQYLVADIVCHMAVYIDG